MKPPPFQYVAAESRDHAIALLAEHGPEGRVLAGGQSLVPLLNRRLVRPAVVIDITRARDLQRIGDGPVLRIGAGVPQSRLERSADAARRAPLLGQALEWVGSVATKNRGTAGGSAAFADPAGELPAALLALDAELVAHSARGERRIPAAQFFTGAFATALAADELLAELRVPTLAATATSCFAEVARRRGGSRAIAGVAAVGAVDRDGVCTTVRIALSGVADTPLRARAAERMLSGARIDEALLDAAAETAAAGLEPPSDPTASSTTRRHLARTLVRRALATVMEGRA
ncbi:FAD binding domain-containing protein [Capillimicrobium parvum]|uniref:6-hydroxypseudooxynicotine dehydrogenase complex subunit alpha n=1 Tax=Capillimicrobium parvum TaxID=2884022 RepID=A0A9E7C252_9ACTN|nr:FAD binding domain-containing protein [Capillimicrobium parvum]UGS37272.1 6-hydroxypseudooxynicotine dehydrogenase complex subunit alpha [Capillimicrobium parvum]